MDLDWDLAFILDFDLYPGYLTLDFGRWTLCFERLAFDLLL